MGARGTDVGESKAKVSSLLEDEEWRHQQGSCTEVSKSMSAEEIVHLNQSVASKFGAHMEHMIHTMNNSVLG
jgi:hypothetical protein